MKIFECPNCKSTIFFENSECENCNNKIGFHLKSDSFLIPETLESNLKYCSNHQLNTCNWLVDKNSDNELCEACELNRKIPNQNDTDNFQKWQKLEFAKHRLVYQLYQLNLPIISKIKNENGLAFDFLAENNQEKKLTGHADGVVTIILTEADSVQREQLRKQMSEPYRTLLGHFRHEIGHYYWMFLFNDETLNEFRDLFGDETQDYGKALELHYKNGAPKNWNSRFISTYASSHPWEDWAETWAHYLHIMDTLETASLMGLSIKNIETTISKNMIADFKNPYKEKDFKKIFNSSVALTSAANSLNRSMGLPDIYPFVIPEPVYKKLEFIHNLLLNTKVELN